MKLLKNSEQGQALIEYILIFGFMALILVNFTKGINKVFCESIGSLRVLLSDELTTGVCKGNNCLYDDGVLSDE